MILFVRILYETLVWHVVSSVSLNDKGSFCIMFVSCRSGGQLWPAFSHSDHSGFLAVVHGVNSWGNSPYFTRQVRVGEILANLMNCRNSPKKAPKLTVSLHRRHLISMAENQGLTSLPGLTAPNCSWNLLHPRLDDTLKHLFMVHLSKEHVQFLLSIDFDPVSQITCTNRDGFCRQGELAQLTRKEHSLAKSIHGRGTHHHYLQLMIGVLKL